jgi:hypothetical protein
MMGPRSLGGAQLVAVGGANMKEGYLRNKNDGV